MSETMTKIEAGKYRHASGATIEKRGKERRGRTGYALAGWSVVVGGREVSRWATLARAAEEAGK